MDKCDKWDFGDRKKAMNAYEFVKQEEEAAKRFDPIQRPKHYIRNGMEAIDVIEAFASNNYHRGNALKYLLRADQKGAVAEDLKKAVWFIQRELAQVEHHSPGYSPGYVGSVQELGDALKEKARKARHDADKRAQQNNDKIYE